MRPPVEIEWRAWLSAAQRLDALGGWPDEGYLHLAARLDAASRWLEDAPLTSALEPDRLWYVEAWLWGAHEADLASAGELDVAFAGLLRAAPSTLPLLSELATDHPSSALAYRAAAALARVQSGGREALERLLGPTHPERGGWPRPRDLTVGGAPRARLNLALEALIDSGEVGATRAMAWLKALLETPGFAVDTGLDLEHVLACLARAAPGRVASLLSAFMEPGVDPKWHKAARRALGELGPSRVTSLESAALGDDPRAGFQALAALTTLPLELQISILRRCAASGRSPQIREEVQLSLDRSLKDASEFNEPEATDAAILLVELEVRLERPKAFSRAIKALRGRAMWSGPSPCFWDPRPEGGAPGWAALEEAPWCGVPLSPQAQGALTRMIIRSHLLAPNTRRALSLTFEPEPARVLSKICHDGTLAEALPRVAARIEALFEAQLEAGWWARRAWPTWLVSPLFEATRHERDPARLRLLLKLIVVRGAGPYGLAGLPRICEDPEATAEAQREAARLAREITRRPEWAPERVRRWGADWMEHLEGDLRRISAAHPDPEVRGVAW